MSLIPIPLWLVAEIWVYHYRFSWLMFVLAAVIVLLATVETWLYSLEPDDKPVSEPDDWGFDDIYT